MVKPQQLKAGSFYRFNHATMGAFYARFEHLDKRESGDEFIQVSILTALGVGQERLANAVIYLSPDGVSTQKRPVCWQDRGLRPSHLSSIDAPSTAVQKEWQTKAANAEQDYAKLREKYLEGVVQGVVSGPSLSELRPAYQRLEDVPVTHGERSFDRRLLAVIPVLGGVGLIIAKLVGLI